MDLAALKQKTALERLAYYLGISKPERAFLLPTTFFICGLLLARFLPRLDLFVPGGAPITQIFLEMIWFAIMYFGVLGCRQFFRNKFGEKAYLAILLFFFAPAGILMMNGILRPIWIEGHILDWVPWALRILIGLYLVTVGILLELKGIKSLGIDRIAFVYTVFPERGNHVTSALYQYLRHPLYAALCHMALGVAFLAGKGEGIWCALIVIWKLFLWSKVEEKELVGRFADDYANYRKQVPAFFPKFSQVKDFWREILS